MTFVAMDRIPKLIQRFCLAGEVICVPTGTTESTLNNSLGNGLSLAVLIYCTANVSGGHLNPAVREGSTAQN